MTHHLSKLILLLLVSFYPVAHAAEVIAIGKEGGFGDSLDQIDLFTTSEPLTKINGTREKGAKVHFSDLKLGKYYLVVWGGPGGWDASPAYDAIINVDRDAVIEHRIHEAYPKRTVELTTDLKLQSFFPKIAAVPCKLQRFQDGVALPFSYRWQWFEETKPGVFTLSSWLEDGTYLVMVPALPYDPQTGEKVPPANILVFPVLFNAGQSTATVKVLTDNTREKQPDKK